MDASLNCLFFMTGLLLSIPFCPFPNHSCRLRSDASRPIRTIPQSENEVHVTFGWFPKFIPVLYTLGEMYTDSDDTLEVSGERGRRKIIILGASITTSPPVDPSDVKGLGDAVPDQYSDSRSVTLHYLSLLVLRPVTGNFFLLTKDEGKMGLT